MKPASFLSGLAAVAVTVILSACVADRQPATITMATPTVTTKTETPAVTARVTTPAPVVTSASVANGNSRAMIDTTSAAAVNASVSAATGKIKLTVLKADSEETASEDGHATNAVDGKPGTMWHTQWTDENPPCPHEIIIELTPPSSIKGFTYLPRQDEEANGTIQTYEFYISDNDKDFGQPVIKGTMPDKGKELATVTFEPKKGRYVKLRALSEINGGAWTSAAEIGVIPN